jgi:hypothetical protein
MLDGVLMRSRTEARWAALFTQLGWDWEYEPIDLHGYVPDFLVKIRRGEVSPLQVEGSWACRMCGATEWHRAQWQKEEAA